MAAATTTTSATATIIQAVEHVVIEEATSLAKQITTKNAAEIKGIVNGVTKEGVAATDDSVSTIIENIEDGAKVVGNEIAKGAEAVVDAVEKHPELIAEGALALGIGVASLVQPGLIVGSVALIGKIAADATKETINEIVVESSTGIVKGVAKEVAEETAELAAEDAAEKAKAVALESAKDESKPGQEATVDVESTGTVTTEVVASDGLKNGKDAGTTVSTTVSGDATAIVKGIVPNSKDGETSVISKETIHTSATATSEINSDSKVVTKEGPSVIVATNDLTGDTKAVVQQGLTTAVVEKPSSTETVPGQPKPAAMATADVKALAKEVAREMTEIEATKAKGGQTGEEALASAVAPESSSPNELLKTTISNLEADDKNSATKANIESSKSVEEPAPVKTEAVEKSTTTEKAADQDNTDMTGENTSVVDPNGKTQTTEPRLEPNGNTTQESPQASQPATSIDNGSHAITHAAVLSAHDKIAALHQSNEILHQKLDTMQESLLAITKALAERNSVVVRPDPEPEATEQNQIVLATPPAALNKNFSIFGNIGWLFRAGSAGKHKRGKSIATSTPATVTPRGGEISG